MSRRAILGTGAFLALTGVIAGAAMAETIYLSAEMRGATEAEGISPDATGRTEVTLDTETNVIEWTTTFSGLSGPVFAAHIHGPAVPGEDAGIQVEFDLIGVGDTITGSAEITDQQVGELLDGMYYVNVHTEQQRGGEIRGFLAVDDDAM
jgi:hypothetical protein